MHHNGSHIKVQKGQSNITLAMHETGLSAKISPQIKLDHGFITLGHTSNELKHKNATMHHTGPCITLAMHHTGLCTK